MSLKTKTYNLEYFKQGSYYSARADSHRFVTMDYNLESFVGIVGIGVLQGWEIDPIGGLTVQILPGQGIADGFFVESDYTVEQRSDMVAGDREIEVLNEDDISEPVLTQSQRAQYVSVVQLYDPSFDNPSVGNITNSYVKVVVPTQMTVPDNTDTYIYAQRPANATPYPLLNDYPPAAGIPPNRGDFANYDDYEIQLNIYKAKLAAIHEYEWYTNPDNHFTKVDFVSSTGLIVSSSKILLGKVSARSGSVSKVDVSGVSNIANLESKIKAVATEFLVKHTHGGNKYYDPPKIQLTTDIRDTSFWNYNSTTGLIVYHILESSPTSISLGHKHTYAIDASGNGQTIELIGSTNPHFHKIASFVVGDPEYTTENVDAHIHTIPAVSSEGSWDNNSRFVAYVNGSVIGDESTPYIHLNHDQMSVTFDKGVSASNSKYSTSFSIDFLDPINSTNNTPNVITVNYNYTARDVSVLHFMLSMEADFNAKYSQYFQESVLYDLGASGTVTNLGVIADNLAKNPFVFISNGQSAGLQNLYDQSAAAQSLLKQVGDIFTFTPDAANNISIVLTEVGYIDQVKIEFLGNTEVTGKLRPENIVYLNANKILTGEFIPQVIPFVSHVGRMKESCFPLQYAMMSIDGIRYSVVPTITDIALGHYHKMVVNTQTTGATTDLMIANDVIYYQNDSDNNTYFIYHAHGVSDGTVATASSEELLSWYNNVYSVALTSSDHTHNVIYPVIGNEKTIYAIREDVNGNIYVGTSDGFMIIPQEPAYQFIVNGVELFFYGSDLWSLLSQQVRSQYEALTHDPLIVTEELYGAQLSAAFLSDIGSSTLLTATPYPNRPTDNIMIKRVSSFRMPGFGYTVVKPVTNVLPSETIIGTQDTTDVIVERDFNDVPIWSIELNTNITNSQDYVASNISTDVIVTGSNLIAKSVGINKTPYQPWSSTIMPFAVNIIRKTIKDPDNNYWAGTNNGVLVSRSYSGGNAFEFTSLPGGNPDIHDILNGERGAVYSVSPAGIFKTTDGGKSWEHLFFVIGGFKQIVRDRTLDKSNIVNGHYHKFDVDNDGNGFLSESIGSGTNHVHVVTNWNVIATMGHTHTMIVSLYAVDNSKVIWRSEDNGSSWSQYGNLPDGECGDIYAAFGCLFVSQQLGLYKSTDGLSWQQVLTSKAYSYEWSYDMSELLIGSDNNLYGTLDGVNFDIVYAFKGNPSPILISNDSQQYFGYAYDNHSQTFHFKSLVLSTDRLAALVDFEKWYALNGGWSSAAPYDIYVNYKRVLSTKYNQDQRAQFGFNFLVTPSNGELDFSATTSLAQQVNIYDSSITVNDSSSFIVGDSIVATSNVGSLYTTIAAINGNTLTLDSRSAQVILLPSAVKKVPALNGQSDVLMNIYDSPLSNAGTLSHDQIEDGLSNYSDGRPYKFNDTYLSNLLQLTQAVRYVYPDINSQFINDMFYDFRYSWSPSDPLYPDINNYIDILTSEIYNQKVYDNNFVGEWAKSINQILVGFGPFEGNVIVATDVGVFISELTPNFEANWFYVNDLPYAAYDLMIFNETLLYVATSNGTYYSSDLKTWTLEKSLTVSYPSYSLGLRWLDQTTITIPAHAAQFIPNSITNLGTIVASSGTPYDEISVNQGVKITGAGDKNGSYIVSNVGDSGGGFGSQIIVSPSFDQPSEVFDNVQMTMGSWWGQWNGDINTANPNITNTLLIGGKDHISYNDGTGFWFESSFSNVSDFVSGKFLPLSNGRMLLSANGTNADQMTNYLLKSDDIGKQWDVFNQFDSISGNILSFGVSNFNNTVLTIGYTQPIDYVYVNGILDQRDIAVYVTGSSIAFYRGKVVWNEVKNGLDTITVYDNALASLLNELTQYTFVVFPSKINTIAESTQETVFYGTDNGLYYDVNTAAANIYPQGTVTNAGINAIIQNIDISGNIISMSIDSTTQNTGLSVMTDLIIRGGDLTGKYLYITDVYPIEKYPIVSNTSFAPGDEFVIQISVAAALPPSYLGKKFKIVGDNSRLYVNFDTPVSPNQFNGGKFYITSVGSNNLGQSYDIYANGTDYIDLGSVIVPDTTLTSTATAIAMAESSTAAPVKIGQSIRLVDQSGRLTLWVALDRSVKENALNNLSLDFDNASLFSNVGSISIYSNLENSITISTSKIADIATGDTFVIKGSFFEQVGGFSHLQTSLDSGHYHAVETVNAMVSGSILSFSNNNASYVDINVTDTTNFNTILVQEQGDLFNGAQIVFTLPQSVSLRYISEVVSHTPTTIRVRITSASYWDFSSANLLKISAGWQWEIDGTNYGYTSGITYKDFVVLAEGVTETANRGSHQLKIQDTSLPSPTPIHAGDMVRIQDSTLTSEINYVASVTDLTTIQLVSPLSKTYFIQNNPQIKVLRDTFVNTSDHKHQIRNNEVQPLSIPAYLDNGYPSQHSHRVLPLITDISVLLNQNNNVVVFGSSSIIYSSSDNGLSWTKVVDLNDFLEGSAPIEGISSAILHDNDFVVGATNGNLFVQAATKGTVVKLNSPI